MKRKKEERVCLLCDTNHSVCWADGPEGSKTLCRACGQKYTKNKSDYPNPHRKVCPECMNSTIQDVKEAKKTHRQNHKYGGEYPFLCTSLCGFVYKDQEHQQKHTGACGVKRKKKVVPFVTHNTRKKRRTGKTNSEDAVEHLDSDYDGNNTASSKTGVAQTHGNSLEDSTIIETDDNNTQNLQDDDNKETTSQDEEEKGLVEDEVFSLVEEDNDNHHVSNNTNNTKANEDVDGLKIVESSTITFELGGNNIKEEDIKIEESHVMIPKQEETKQQKCDGDQVKDVQQEKMVEDDVKMPQRSSEEKHSDELLLESYLFSDTVKLGNSDEEFEIQEKAENPLIQTTPVVVVKQDVVFTDWQSEREGWYSKERQWGQNEDEWQRLIQQKELDWAQEQNQWAGKLEVMRQDKLEWKNKIQQLKQMVSQQQQNL